MFWTVVVLEINSHLVSLYHCCSSSDQDESSECRKRNQWARQSDRNAAGIPRNQASSPSSPPPLSSIAVHKSIRSFNVPHNGQGELFCDYNARKRYLSAKKVGALEAPRSGEQSVRKPEQVPTSCENILQQRRRGERSAGCATVDNSTAERLLKRRNRVANE